MNGPKWRLFRQDAGRAAGPAPIVYVLLFVLSIALGQWSILRYGAVFVWPANAVMLAAFLQLPRRQAMWVLGICFAINLAGNFLRVDESERALLNAGLNLGEAVLAGVVARRFCGAALDMRRPTRLARFALLAVAPAIALTAVTSLTATRTPLAEIPSGVFDYFMIEGLGLLTVTPTLLLLARRHRFQGLDRCSPWEIAGEIGLLAAVTAGVFAQPQAPALFLVFLPLLLIAFRLPPTWSAIAILVVVSIGSGFTLNGMGPTVATGEARVLGALPMFLLFMSAVLAVALPASTVLTERRRLEARLKARTEAAILARKQAERAAEAKSRFLSMMSHELRTPLNGVSGYAELLAGRKCLDAEAAGQVEQIRRSSGALVRLVEDILDFSRGEAEPVNAPFSLAVLVETAAAEACAETDAKGLWLAVSGDLDPTVRLVGDERRLRQVLRILLSNAVKFTAEGGVELQVGLAEHGVEIAVCDTGKGLLDDAIPTLFEAFVQGDASIGRDHEGAGMGLALAKRLIDAMDGSISARNRPGGGAIFTLGLPLERAEPAAVQGDFEAPRALRVLVVDDHPVNREVASLLLQALGCETVPACDGLEAVKAARTERFDLILMDVRMPRLDGLAAARRIRALKGPAAKTPIVAVTADAMPEDVARSVEAGMVGHLSKPVTRAHLAETLARHLGGAGETEAPVRRSAA